MIDIGPDGLWMRRGRRLSGLGSAMSGTAGLRNGLSG